MYSTVTANTSAVCSVYVEPESDYFQLASYMLDCACLSSVHIPGRVQYCYSNRFNSMLSVCGPVSHYFQLASYMLDCTCLSSVHIPGHVQYCYSNRFNSMLSVCGACKPLLSASQLYAGLHFLEFCPHAWTCTVLLRPTLQLFALCVWSLKAIVQLFAGVHFLEFCPHTWMCTVLLQPTFQQYAIWV